MLNLFRALFPRWNFFDQVGFQFELFYKLSENQNWVKIDFQQTRRPLSLFYNPDLNLALAQFNVIEHFTQDLQDDGENIERKNSFKLVCSLVDFKLQQQQIQIRQKRFKITARSNSQIFDMYTSPWLSEDSLGTP